MNELSQSAVCNLCILSMLCSMFDCSVRVRIDSVLVGDKKFGTDVGKFSSNFD